MVKAVHGKMATGLSDGWKGKRKRALLAYMANVDVMAYTVGIEDISALPKTVENHLKVVKEAIRRCEDELGMKIIGWVSDTGGDSRGMRIRLGKEHPELLLFNCWAHQIELDIGDILKLKNDLVAAGDDAQEIAKWFMSHSQALGLLHGEQVKANRRPRLLDDRGPLQATVALHRDRLKQIGSRDPERTELASYLRPLAILLNVAQAADTRLHHILITLGRLYQFFNHPSIGPEVRVCVLASIELRWRKADQDAFILAVFFNPYIRCRLFSPSSPDFCANGLYTVVQRVFERVLQKAPESGLFEAFMSYYNWSDVFSAQAWHLNKYSEMYKNEGKDVNLDVIWSTIPCTRTINTGRHQLACLARLILSIVANSACCERLFSRMGNIHTKLRNRLSFERVHDIATVAMDIEAQHQAAGLIRKRTKGRFDAHRPPPALRTTDDAEAADFDSLPDPPTELISAESSADLEDMGLEDKDEEDETGARSLTTLAAQFKQALDDDNDENIAGELEEGLPEPDEVVAYQPCTRPRRLRLYFSKAHAIPFSEVFNFSDLVDGVKEGLGIYWKCGVANLAKEHDIYEAIACMRND
ncbi:unnamed protein product [Rhizoctonia solani]|uniref:HAT C-terminal dimerisation domain-containing protein n=1 Tax=Rhizoctonia solani TaxID=456999 RepID=A0A8H2X0C8_9AGAM|nr:unnamed protein product [Rhizoctonia solani]